MWAQLTRQDLELVKQKLEVLRTMTLNRHAEELKALDTQREEIETLERLVGAVTSKYLNSETSATGPILPVEPTTPAVEVLPPEVHSEAASPGLRIEHRISPNFGIPPRRFVGR